ncbi:hypothetical protein BT63DRAFT_124626 [Microthyrium microscopicum]|uniref:Uncharacterized protein n=1 Tax=Microthyrium microscopicum TaxID=703497 RepID=A0A6A6TTD8_9PEZI|nr:hypothetical protein BT63DRAFT_124626 [Microthyrium microscopicum]
MANNKQHCNPVVEADRAINPISKQKSRISSQTKEDAQSQARVADQSRKPEIKELDSQATESHDNKVDSENGEEPSDRCPMAQQSVDRAYAWMKMGFTIGSRLDRLTWGQIEHLFIDIADMLDLLDYLANNPVTKDTARNERLQTQGSKAAYELPELVERVMERFDELQRRSEKLQETLRKRGSWRRQGKRPKREDKEIRKEWKEITRAVRQVNMDASSLLHDMTEMVPPRYLEVYGVGGGYTGLLNAPDEETWEAWYDFWALVVGESRVRFNTKIEVRE